MSTLRTTRNISRAANSHRSSPVGPSRSGFLVGYGCLYPVDTASTNRTCCITSCIACACSIPPRRFPRSRAMTTPSTKKPTFHRTFTMTNSLQRPRSPHHEIPLCDNWQDSPP